MSFCQKCGTKIADGAKFCPGCGAKCDSSSAPAASKPVPETKQTLTPEQLAFYAEQEEKCRQEMKSAVKWMIVIPIISLVPGFILMILVGIWVWFLLGGIGFVGTVLEAVVYAVNAKKLEKLQRERVFGKK